MKKVAIFGKPGSGKSTLSKALAKATGLPLYPLDSLVYQANGERVAREVFDQAHDEIVSSATWIIDGFGPISAFYQRLDAADTLIYVDLAYSTSYWFVTKRLLKGVFVKPEGWPEGSSVIKGSWQSYKTLKLCPTFWNQDFNAKLNTFAADKQVYVIKSVAELNRFVSQGGKASTG
ncbi:shikimate kinase [Marinomonas posidonica]|uniref:Shikimate kinase n=1 Tax=Marinomonas posidonica (strain CECT 7376 / NCIMB 14433 / IVIA-Po-181) TaxID=491952 RepID=F6CV96_MARPP|nr:shikimate kinase [Marinomonas posidonica]AEF54206.1 shikimate kinase [Marinomonas posidonica IVIA-Po-181]